MFIRNATRNESVLFMLRGLETSEGARMELRVALEMGIPVVQEHNWDDICRINKIGDEK